jgi:hypothetical protein
LRHNGGSPEEVRLSEAAAARSTSAVPAAAPPPHAQILQMTLALVMTRALYVIAELGIADLLMQGPRSAEDLAAATGTHAPSLYRLLRTMAGAGFFVEGADKRFSATPLSATLQSDAPGHLRSTVRALAGPMAWGAWGEFSHAVKTGQTAMDTAFGQPIFEYLAARPEDAGRFNETMIGFHGEEPAAVTAAYDFSELGTVVDVGGGVGHLLTTILAANPQLQGTLFDLPHVAAEARRAIDAKGLTSRCSVVEGSFFETPLPPGADAYVFSHIIHDWDDAKSRAILSNVHRALQGRGRLLLVEMVIPPGNEFHPGKMLDLVMLTFTGGRERTAEEYGELFASNGFRLTRVVPTASAVSVIEAEPIAS